MPTLTLELPSAGGVITSGLHAANYADIQALLNGGLDGSNINQATVFTLGASGITLGGDTNLYRAAASVLKTDGTLRVGGSMELTGATGAFIARSSVGVYPTLVTRQSVDAFDRYSLDNNGAMIWGGGSGTGDTNLYRSAANVLKTDDQFHAVGSLYAGWNAAASSYVLQALDTGMVALPIQGVTGGLLLGGDTNLYRSAANLLATDDSFRTGGTFDSLHATAGAAILQAAVSGEASYRFVIDQNGSLSWGSGAVAQDTNLYRVAANHLKTDDTFEAVGDVRVGASLNMLGATGFIYHPNGAVGQAVMIARATGDPDNRFTIGNDGTMYWGNGTAAADVQLYRTAANELSFFTGDYLKLSAAGIKFNDNTVQTTAAVGSLIGTEIAYAERTSNLALTTTVADMIDTGTVSYAQVPHMVEFFVPAVDGAANTAGVAIFHLYDGATDLGVLGHVGFGTWGSGNSTVRGQVLAARKLTPVAGNHNYKIRAKMDVSTGTAYAGAGGAGVMMPAFCRITREV
jgi:hypothetical protein